jgi:hypothetical protein
MKAIVSFLAGIIFTLPVQTGAGYFAAKAGVVPAGADSRPSALESWVANTALKAAIERDTKGSGIPFSRATIISSPACTCMPKTA